MLSIGRHVSKLSGFAPDLPTPFKAEGEVAKDAFELLCDLQINAGATALCVCGVTGEAPTLSRAEQLALIRIAVETARGRIPVIAATGSNSTAHATEFAVDAERAGADAVLSVVPYYNKPTQTGLYAHFTAVAESTGLPLFLHDVPSRSACGLADDTIARLADTPRIIGLVDGSGDAGRPARLRVRLGADFRLLCGDDAMAVGFLANGGNGCLSVASNIAPELCRDLYLALRRGEFAAAQRLAAGMTKLTAAMSIETNPGPLKYALSLLELASPHLRLPLVEPNEHSRAEILAVLGELAATYDHGTVAPLARTAMSAAHDKERRRGG